METKSKKYFESNRMIIKIMRKIYLLCRIYKLIAFINTKRRNGVSKPYEPVYIPTDMIYKMINDKNSNKYRFYNQRYMIRKFGLIQNGDWDLDLFDITSLPIFELFQQRFIEKLRWENTNYYKTAFYLLKYHSKKQCLKLKVIRRSLGDQGFIDI